MESPSWVCWSPSYDKEAKQLWVIQSNGKFPLGCNKISLCLRATVKNHPIPIQMAPPISQCGAAAPNEERCPLIKQRPSCSLQPSFTLTQPQEALPSFPSLPERCHSAPNRSNQLMDRQARPSPAGTSAAAVYHVRNSSYTQSPGQMPYGCSTTYTLSPGESSV